MNKDGGTNDMVIDLYKLHAVAKELGWEETDEIVIKIAGTRTACIHQQEGANPRWSPPFGTVSHNKDAQIVIENLSRRDSTPSTPMDEAQLSGQFVVGDDGQLYKARELEELPESTEVVDTAAPYWYNVINWIREAVSKRTTDPQ